MAKFLRLINGVPRMQEESSFVAIYDEEVIIGAGGLTAGSPLALPLSKTYSDDELEVYFRGQRIESVYDYNYYGSVPRISVTFTFDLVEGDKIRFRIDRPE